MDSEPAGGIDFDPLEKIATNFLVALLMMV
jgi:hypothetical protein